MKKKTDAPAHPDHSKHKGRLKRVEGQIQGISRMIDNKRYCPDILIQLRAAANALLAIEEAVLSTHLQGCVRKAVRAKDGKEIDRKITEIMKMINR